ncbi:MAG: hypothetical protein KA275_03390 [Chitinophagaceae bacterium]|nr:hypothetical protein [Chitinophagaceae bacterium]
MKKLIIFTLMMLAVVSVDAQRKRKRTATSQGNVALRFGMGINSDKTVWDFGDVESRMNTLEFMPSVSYFIIDNLEIGVNLGITNGRGEDRYTATTSQETTMTDVHFGIFAQKYFPLNNWFALQTNANIGLNTGNYNTNDIVSGTVTNDPTQSGESNGVSGGINFGFAFTPYNAFGLWADVAGFGVQNTKVNPGGANDTYSNTNVGFNVARQPLSIGAAWYFGRGLWRD